MTKENKKQLQTLLALVVLLAGVGFYEYWTNFRTTQPAATTQIAANTKSFLLGNQNAQILIDMMKDTPAKDVVGKKNVFEYYVPPPPPKPTPPPQPAVVVPQPNPQTNRPVTPPPPPPPDTALNRFAFEAIGIVAKPGKLWVSISEGPNNHYNVTEGECIMGRYCVNKASDTSVEIEDVQLNQRRTFPRKVLPQ